MQYDIDRKKAIIIISVLAVIILGVGYKMFFASSKKATKQTYGPGLSHPVDPGSELPPPPGNSRGQ